MFQLRFYHPKLKWKRTTFPICHFEFGALRAFEAEDFSRGHRRVDANTKEAEQIPTISVDCGFFGLPEDSAHPVLIVRDRKSKGIWSHPVPSKGVVHPYPARALMADLDFMGYRRVILKSDQEPSIVALCDAVKNGWHGEVVPEASPPEGDPNDSEVENTVMNSLAELWRENNDPTMRSTCSSVSSVINTFQACMRLARTSQCARSPRHLSHMTSVDGVTSTTRLASCSTTLLSRERGLRTFRSLVSWVSGRLSTDPVWKSCLARDGLTSTRVMKTSPSTTVGWSYRLVIFYSHSTTGGTAKFVDLCNSRRAPQ